jgi:hypothetical protein
MAEDVWRASRREGGSTAQPADELLDASGMERRATSSDEHKAIGIVAIAATVEPS